jgi:hypothetical protein
MEGFSCNFSCPGNQNDPLLWEKCWAALCVPNMFVFNECTSENETNSITHTKALLPSSSSEMNHWFPHVASK